MVAVRRWAQVVVIGIRDHAVVGRIAAVEPLPALPTMILEAVGYEPIGDEPVLDDLAVVDLLVAAAIVSAEVSGGSRSGHYAGEGNRSAGKCESNLFHFHLHSFKRRLGVDVEMDLPCRTTIAATRENCRKLSQDSAREI